MNAFVGLNLRMCVLVGWISKQIQIEVDHRNVLYEWIRGALLRPCTGFDSWPFETAK